MAAQLGHSKSLKYLITKWFNEVKETNDEYLVYLQKIIRKCNDTILEPTLELQRIYSKSITNEIINKKKEIVVSAQKLEPYLVEFKEYTLSYRVLIEELDGFGLAFNSKRKALDFLVQELENQEKLLLNLKNLLKALNVVFRKGSKQNKRNELEFENYLKEFNRRIKTLERDFDSITQILSTILVELSNEVEKSKEEEESSDKS